MKILFITPNAPWPTHTGSAQRSSHLWQALTAKGSVTTVCLESESHLGSENCEVLRTKYNVVSILPRTPLITAPGWSTLAKVSRKLAARMANFLDASRSRYKVDKTLVSKCDLERLIGESDLVVCRYLHTAACTGALNAIIPCVVDLDDLDSSILQSQINSPTESIISRWLAKRHLRNIAKAERLAIDKASALWVADPDDKLRPGLQDALVLHNIPLLQQGDSWNEKPPAYKQKIGFIASFAHVPNVEGINWFLSAVWPTVQAKYPEASLNIYGSQITEINRLRWETSQAGVNVVGFVDHVSSAYSEMDFSICPIQRGAGTNIKVLEAAFHSRLCVVTSVAARGIATRNTEIHDSMITCDSAASMAEAINNLLEDDMVLSQQTAQFQSAITRHYSREQFNSIVNITLSNLTS